jgi:hypothetical protein
MGPISRILLVFVCLLGTNQWLSGQDEPAMNEPAQIPQTDVQQSAPPSATFAGTFIINFTITTPIFEPAKVFDCTVDAVVDDVGGTSILERKTGIGSGNGTTGVCTVQFGYSWKLASAGTDKVKLTYRLLGSQLGVFTGRFSKVTNFLIINVPANGATTTLTVTATL